MKKYTLKNFIEDAKTKNLYSFNPDTGITAADLKLIQKKYF